MVDDLLEALITIVIEGLAEIIPVKGKSGPDKDTQEAEKAISQKKVHMSKRLILLWAPSEIILFVMGVLLILFPEICDSIGFDYKLTLLALWIPSIMSAVVVFPRLVRLEYGEDEFRYTNAFGFTRTFRYEEVTAVIEARTSFKVITPRKKIRFGKKLCGARTFVVYLKERLQEKSELGDSSIKEES